MQDDDSRCDPAYDPKDPWAQRFVAKSKRGECYLNTKAIGGLDARAGQIFVQMVTARVAQERAATASQLTAHARAAAAVLSNIAPAAAAAAALNTTHTPSSASAAKSPRCRQRGAGKGQPPPVMSALDCMNGDRRQLHGPFRRTFLDDERDPQSGTGFEHAYEVAAKENGRTWSRGGLPFSRVPRFQARKGGVFAADPGFHLPSAPNAQYETLQPFRSPERHPRHSQLPSTSRLRRSSLRPPQHQPQLEVEVGARPPLGPNSYQPFTDSWAPREVCGEIPPSSMFAKTTGVKKRRPHPRSAPPALAVSTSTSTASVTSHKESSTTSPPPVPVPAPVPAAAAAAAAAAVAKVRAARRRKRHGTPGAVFGHSRRVMCTDEAALRWEGERNRFVRVASRSSSEPVLTSTSAAKADASFAKALSKAAIMSVLPEETTARHPLRLGGLEGFSTASAAASLVLDSHQATFAARCRP
eukprot:TRINITY_DN1268_c0_g1_i1.p1 TRINITY_DN1268_c0_g1~~TRINITY_DN1268_c0_g1_i1.p1  ORF type:complete len:470 (+),score=76.50 TRINITY_DN1268_c0_g1_i1:231-1640(+)